MLCEIGNLLKGNKMKIDVWILILIFVVIVAFLAAMCGCNSLGISQPTVGAGTLIPSSPAAQMWKVVAKSNWVVTICLLGFGGGVFAYANGMTKLGLSVILSCVATLFFGLAIHRFPTWMAVFGLVGAIAAAAASLIMKNRAIVEIIKGGQAFKKDIKSLESTAYLGDNFIAKQKQEQSPTTQKLIKKIKGDLKLKGQI